MSTTLGYTFIAMQVGGEAVWFYGRLDAFVLEQHQKFDAIFGYAAAPPRLTDRTLEVKMTVLAQGKGPVPDTAPDVGTLPPDRPRLPDGRR